MLDGFPIVGLTPSVLLGITVLLLLTGRIVPRVTLQDKSAEAEKWRKAYETEKEARTASDAQTQELLEVAHLTHAIINAMFVSTKEYRQQSGEGDAPS